MCGYANVYATAIGTDHDRSMRTRSMRVCIYNREHAVFTASWHAFTGPQIKPSRCSHPQGRNLRFVYWCACWAPAVFVHAHPMSTAHVFKWRLVPWEQTITYDVCTQPCCLSQHAHCHPSRVMHKRCSPRKPPCSRVGIRLFGMSPVDVSRSTGGHMPKRVTTYTPGVDVPGCATRAAGRIPAVAVGRCVQPVQMNDTRLAPAVHYPFVIV